VDQEYLIDDGLVERLHAALAEALRRTRTDPFGSPVTVAEIYQDLVPYRTVRTALGFQMNADYEYTVLRMLAGEGGHARLEPAEAKDELRAELEAPNPNVGLFRKFAACDVWIEPSDATPPQASHPPEPIHVAAEAFEPPPEPIDIAAEAFEPPPESTPAPESLAPQPEPDAGHPEASLPEPMDLADFDLASSAAEPAEPGEPQELADLSQVDWESEGVVWAEPGSASDWDEPTSELLLEEAVEDAVAPSDTSEEAAPVRNEATHQPETDVMFDQNQTQTPVADHSTAGGCAFCQSSLPSGRVVRFCPFCGADQSLNPCGTCREPLDPAWKFCIACGNEQA